MCLLPVAAAAATGAGGAGISAGALYTAAGLSLAGGAIGAYSQIQQGRFSEEMGEVNQKIAEQNAVAGESAGAIEADRVRRQGRQFRSAQAATIAANNLDLSSGTPLDLLLDTTRGFEQDAQATQYNSAMEARGLRIQGRNIARQGRFDRRSSYVGAGATILGSAASAAGQYGTARYYGG